MNQLEVITGQYNKTILELQTRIVQAALELNAMTEQAEELKAKFEAAAKELSQLKGEPTAEARPHLEAVSKDGAAKEV